tara:strand:- start:543 stop:914 length:372 start_codon:yes stop_codon:yes gene_type:complete
MNNNSLFLKAAAIGVSFFLMASANASNPFKRPEIKVVDTPVYEEVDTFDEQFDMEVMLEEPSTIAQPQTNPLLDKESVVFKGSMNGVDVYYDKSSGLYIYDKNDIDIVAPITSSLPKLEQVNY